MFERLLDKSVIPTRDELIEYCGLNKERFIRLNSFLTEKMGTEESIRFPYGNHYGWCITHRIKKKLICEYVKNAITLVLSEPKQEERYNGYTASAGKYY